MERKDTDGKMWMSRFREENHQRLRDRYNQLAVALEECDIPFLSSTAGLFTWLDFSKFLPTDPALSAEERERQLYLRLVNDVGLLLTPGASMRNERTAIVHPWREIVFGCRRQIRLVHTAFIV